MEDNQTVRKSALLVDDILKALPHRYPFLLIDRITRREGLDRAWGHKHLSYAEHFFQGHFPDRPEMPYSLLLESMAQMGATIIMDEPVSKGKYILFGSLDHATFDKPAEPGQTLEFEAEMLNYKVTRGKTRITCFVEGEQIAQADFIFALADKIDS